MRVAVIRAEVETAGQVRKKEKRSIIRACDSFDNSERYLNIL